MKHQNLMRLFIGVVPTDVSNCEPLLRVFKKLKRSMAHWKGDVRWTNPTNWHVTTHFLGNLDHSTYELLAKDMATWSLPTTSFSLKLRYIGAFPTPNDAHVIWVGVAHNKNLIELRHTMNSHLSRLQLSLNDDETYQPHLTLARLRNSSNVTRHISIAQRMEFGEFAVEKVVLFQSVLEGRIPKYIPLLTVNTPSVA